MPAEQITGPLTLAELLQGLVEAPELPVLGISSDSRALEAGDLFLAVPGLTRHGIDFVDDAIDAGVVAIAYDSSTATAPERDTCIPMLPIDGLERHLGTIANRFFGAPSASVRVIGVTGTNGKTSVAWFIAQCLERLGESCAYLGTLGSGLGSIMLAESMTTPATIEMHRQLANFRDRGARFAAIEVSSHALLQNRVDGVAFDTVLFTNLSRDHLDYHGDMQSYGDAKARLFVEYSARHRIINVDTEFGRALADRCGPDVITVSAAPGPARADGAFVSVQSIGTRVGGSQLAVRSSWGDCKFMLPLPGAFNVENAVMTLALLLSQGLPPDGACAAMEQVKAPPGRMQAVPGDESLPAVFVDYAHSPAALELALRSLRNHCRGELWCVFGCGGDRDRGKRPQMGKVAVSWADRVIVTSDNPRNEAPDDIIAHIVAGMDEPAAATVIEDRATAIGWAIAGAGAGDIILIAGKGHEAYQWVGDERRDFSDFGVALANLERRAETRA